MGQCSVADLFMAANVNTRASSGKTRALKYLSNTRTHEARRSFFKMKQGSYITGIEREEMNIV